MQLKTPAGLVALLVCASLSFAGYPVADEQSDRSAGFDTGRYCTTAESLATELDLISSMCSQFRVEEQSRLSAADAASRFTQEEQVGAAAALAYTSWRLRLFVEPLCNAGLSAAALPAAVERATGTETAALLKELKSAARQCIAGGDLAAVADFCSAVETAGFAGRLRELALTARAAADSPAEQ